MSEISEDEVRREVRAWLAENWDPNLSLLAWRNKLADSGWGMPQWPRQWYGRGLPARMVRIVEEEFAAVGAIGCLRGGIGRLAAARISRAPPRARISTAKTGLSTARRSGPPAPIMPSGARCWPAPIGTRPNTRACPISSSI